MYGRLQIYRRKTLEGFISFFIVIIVSLWVFDHQFPHIKWEHSFKWLIISIYSNHIYLGLSLSLT